ncbi:hypothetical protein [Actinomadura chokoriensis]|uniref:DUF485 domain-containing protein n=1 Tax=Actinomadura chokoriensis TaxID=454156 RepID=A0ABV4QV61_9ACTN
MAGDGRIGERRTGERRVVVSAGAGVRERAPGEGGAPPTAEAAGSEAAGSEPPDPDPLHSGPSLSAAFAAAPPPKPAETRALIRAQLRTALGTCAIVLTVLAGLPLLALVPAVAHAHAHGVPLFWAVLASGVQPFLIAVSFRQLRRAERSERAMDRR